MRPCFFAHLILSILVLSPLAFSEENARESNQENVRELLAEIALRDSIMELRDSACVVEKDSLRSAVVMEQSLCRSFQQSYETMKKDNESCARALRAAKEDNENRLAEEPDESSVIVPTSTFLGGLGLGMLLFWLIFE
ncbi:MAG: hypothetical protein HUK20_07435 [Fibrobacter sp.]|nr:hypothetical protein [Fibrobacter sp.]